MAIGNYWHCVLPERESTPPLQRIVGESTKMAQHHFSSWRFDPEGEDAGGADFACLGMRDGDMRAIVHLVKPAGRPNYYLHSAFPWLAGGAPARLRLTAVKTDHFGLEGFILGTLDGGRHLGFFDPLFALNKASYRFGDAREFRLAAVSSDLKRSAGERVRITNPKTVADFRESERAIAGEPWSPPEYVDLDLSQARGIMAAADDTSDYYVFHGTVRQVRHSSFLDRPFLTFRTDVLDAEASDIAIDIYVDRERFRRKEIPAVSENVMGTMWLQGYLA
jgi:hypothetical protein